ncbi:Protein cms1 [Coniosporium apollinis]|uniref:Protein cms1 n=2 Tax=Coniosporium TaxID=2810619 RepID=A0ABQ9NX97_9PEZI|nr:Protein cms1 [Cladosporium sp. JES 115]KAJ9665929.1 Protein cms1 [Coniosporium apollinis]
MSESEAGGIPLLEPLSPSTSPAPTSSTKRKREAEPKSKRAAKRKRTKKPKDIDKNELDDELGVNTAIARMDSRLLADYVAQRTKRFESELSLVELEDRYLPERAIRDTSTWEEQRDLEHLPAFLEEFGKGLKEAPKAKGSPHTLVVTSAGLRAADLTRALRKFQSKDATVAKLFAKHIKLKEAIESCKKTRMGIGVGTPQRIIDLLDDGALSSDNLKRIVIDASHIDQKKRGILDMKEIEVPLVQLLGREEFKKRYGAAEKRLELLFY